MDHNTPQKIDEGIKNLIDTDKLMVDALKSIISQLPMTYKQLIEQTFIYKRVPKEYMLSSILFAVSSSIGTTFYINALGYKNYGNCYFAIVGSRGDAKSEAIKIATLPIKQSDDLEYENYKREISNNIGDEPSLPRKQILLKEASIEAAQKVHSENPRSTGICMDEIIGLIEKMSNSNSRDGIAWRNFFLEGYTNDHIDVARKTTESFRLKETYPTLIGGLQHQFLHKLFANGNLESGFIDRLLFTNMITSNTRLVKGSIERLVLTNYNRCLNNILSYKKQTEKPTEPIKQFEIIISKSAQQMLFDYTQDLISQKSKAPKNIKEYLAKMQISIQKLCIVVYVLNHSDNIDPRIEISDADVSLAIELNEFYYLNFKSIIDKVFVQKEKPVSIEDVIIMAKKNNASQKAVVELTGLSKGTISKKWNKT
jgi:hypothetical protein